jgi:7-cyano-7-deazaguanine synthase
MPHGVSPFFLAFFGNDPMAAAPSNVSRPAILLLSGGLDSTTVLAQAMAQGFQVHALSFDYGQRQTVELAAARAIAHRAGAHAFRIARIDLGAWGGSALTSHDIDVPKDTPITSPDASRALGGASSIPVTYVPARNTIFLSYALAWAEVVGARDLFIGANAVDYSGYPDCRPAFIEAFERLANLATRAADGGPAYRVHAPLMKLSKKDIILLGQQLGVDYSLTHSCYDPEEELACGRCEACQLRRRGFEAAGVADPTRYVIA